MKRPRNGVRRSRQYLLYARMLSVGLRQPDNDLLNAAVEQTEIPISSYVRRALRMAFEKDRLIAPRRLRKPVARKYERERNHVAA